MSTGGPAARRDRRSARSASSCKTPRSRHAARMYAAAPTAVTTINVSVPASNTTRAASAGAPKQASASPPAVNVPRPNGCSPNFQRSWISGTMLVNRIEADQAVAAPMMPNGGISTRLATMLTAIAASAL